MHLSCKDRFRYLFRLWHHLSSVEYPQMNDSVSSTAPTLDFSQLYRKTASHLSSLKIVLRTVFSSAFPSTFATANHFITNIEK